MVRKPLPVVLALGLLLLVASCVGAAVPHEAPSLEAEVRLLQLAPESVVRLDEDHAVAARDDGSTVRLIDMRFDKDLDRWVSNELASADHGRAKWSTQLLSLGGQTGDSWNTFVYGSATDDASRVTLVGYSGAGGQVVDGAWVVVLHAKDFKPSDLHWRAVDAFGHVLESGTGISPSAQ
jgi:hypothetical protein